MFSRWFVYSLVCLVVYSCVRGFVYSFNWVSGFGFCGFCLFVDFFSRVFVDSWFRVSGFDVRVSGQLSIVLCFLSALSIVSCFVFVHSWHKKSKTSVFF